MHSRIYVIRFVDGVAAPTAAGVAASAGGGGPTASTATDIAKDIDATAAFTGAVTAARAAGGSLKNEASSLIEM